jgi:hypothetical protein
MYKDSIKNDTKRPIESENSGEYREKTMVISINMQKKPILAKK